MGKKLTRKMQEFFLNTTCGAGRNPATSKEVLSRQRQPRLFFVKECWRDEETRAGLRREFLYL